MDEPEMFIVTVECPNEKTTVDLELPAGLPIRELRVKLLDVLKSQYGGRFLNLVECRLIYENRFLKDGETLAQAGAFDGSRLIVMKE